METVKIGLVGYGTVGSAFYKLVSENGKGIAEKTGLRPEIVKIGVRDPAKPRDGARRELFTAGYEEILRDPAIDVVVELAGGTSAARELVRRALESGKHVVTANKALLAEHGKELFAAAAKAGRELKFEASVAGGIPIIKVIREGLMGNRIRSIVGILNGTTNYILTQMTDRGLGFAEALAEAQRAGFAEADPTLDVGGIDAAQKISILASIAFGAWVDYRDVLCEGITTVEAKDIEFARMAGFVVKLVAGATEVDGLPSVTVFPALVSTEHPLAAVRNEYNAIHLDCDYLGSSVYIGRGAGGNPTASAVASDIGDLLQILSRDAGPARSRHPGHPLGGSGALYPAGEREYRYFFHLVTENRPGIWATVTGLLASSGMNIESVHQKWIDRSLPSDLYVLVDPAKEAMARGALDRIVAAEGIYPESRFYRILAG
jgi:homoserine dehydrogenase